MTGKRYYITTHDAWQRHAHRFAQSHYVALDEAKILVLVEADEGAHLALEDDSAFEALPHPFTQTPISPAEHAAICAHLATESLAPGATTFDAAEAAARLHPLLRPRVF